MVEVKTIDEVVRATVTCGERIEVENCLRKSQKAAELILSMRNVCALRVRGNNDQRHSEAEAVVIELRGWHVIIPSPRVVPGDENCR